MQQVPYRKRRQAAQAVCEADDEKGASLMERAEILDAAKRCVCGERELDYGTPENSFKVIGKLTENRANLEGDAMYMENRAMQRKLDEALKYIPHSCECCSHQRSAGACALLPEGDEFSVDYTDGYDRDDCEHWELRIPTK